MTRHVIDSPVWPGASFTLHEGWQSRQALLDSGAHRGGARWPHHSSSILGLLGQVRMSSDASVLKVQPGELLLAGAGFLVLEDLPEWRRSTLEALASAWRFGAVRLASRDTDFVVELPARCSIVATAVGCPCGFHDAPPGAPGARSCRCTEGSLKRWNRRIDDALALFRGIRRTATHDVPQGDA